MDEVGGLSSLFFESCQTPEQKVSATPSPKSYWFKDLSELKLLADDHMSTQETERMSNAQRVAFGSHHITVRASCSDTPIKPFFFNAPELGLVAG